MLICLLRWNNVVILAAREEELLVLIEYERTKIFLKVGEENAPIIAISDSATVHGIPNQIPKSLPRKLLFTSVVCLLKIHINETVADLEV